jgi:hypothetical protein
VHSPRWRPRGAVLAGMRAAIARLPRLDHTQRQIRRLLVAYGPMTTGELAALNYARPTQRWHWGNVSRSATKFAVGKRVRGPGGPWVWALNHGHLLITLWDSGGRVVACHDPRPEQDAPKIAS